MLDDLSNGIGKAIKTVPDIYDDALKPSAQKSGKVLALIPETVYSALLPLRKWNIQREYNFAETEKLLAQKLENVGEDKIITPESYVAIPAIQAISYSMDSEELRDLYTNLLSKAMNTDTKDSVHPAFIETIKQLSPIDAAYFKHIFPLPGRPMCEVLLTNPNSLTHTLDIWANLFSENFKDTYRLSIDNLSRLGLINIPHDIWYGDDHVYTDLLNVLKQKYTLSMYISKFPNALDIEFEKQRIDITEYGKAFYNTCVI